jgi:integrase
MIKSEKFCWNSIITIPQALFQLLPAAGPDEYVFDVHDFTLREHFKLYRARAGLDAIYMESAPRGVAGAPAKCRRLTLHSLRHYAIQRFYEQTKNPDLTRAFARHKRLDTTQHYLKRIQQKDVDKVIQTMCLPTLIMANNKGCSK